jgi:glycosyltransferase involved in cell wall biosynthesis
MTAAPDRERIGLMEFATVFAIGGTERQLVNLANGIDPARFDLHLGCLLKFGSLLKEIEGRPLAEYHIDHLYGFRTLREQLKLAAYLRRHRIQLFHAQGFYPNVFGIAAARLAGTPAAIASIRDLGDSLTHLQALAQRMACGLADGIVVNAEAVRRQLVADGYPPEKIHVIHNGVDLSRFAVKDPPVDIRPELGLPPGVPLVAVVSRLDPLKGIEDFLEAARQVAARSPMACFLVVGDICVKPNAPSNGYRGALERRAERLGLGRRVVFTGFRHDVWRILSQVSVSVLPSHSEALSNTLIESMAAGVPVVATSVGGNPEVVEDGITGVLVPPRNPAMLSHAICELLEKPEQAARFGRAGRQRVEEHFSIDRMVRQTEQLYLKLIAQSHRGARAASRLPDGHAPSSPPIAP